MRDGDLGLAEIQLLPGWKATTIPHCVAGIQITDRLRRNFVMVISESRDDFTADMDLWHFREMTFGQLISGSQMLEIHGPEARPVASQEALHTEVLLANGMVLTKYLHTVIAGERAFHQIVAWAPASTYDRPSFEKVIVGFAERQGPKPKPKPGARTADSRYDVH